MEMLERAEKCALTNSVLDFTLHPIIYHPTPDIIAEMPRMAEAGYYSIKIFTLFQVRQEDQGLHKRYRRCPTARHDHHDALRRPAHQRLFGQKADRRGQIRHSILQRQQTRLRRGHRHGGGPLPSAGPRGRASTWCIYRRRRRWKWPAVIPSRDNACTSRPGPSTSTWTSEITTSQMRRSTRGGHP